MASSSNSRFSGQDPVAQVDNTSEKDGPECICATNFDIVRLSQQWSIANFSSLVKLCKPGQCLRSHSFSHPFNEDVNWQLCMYPGGKRDENKGFVSLFLKMYAPPAKDVCIMAEYRLYFMQDTGEKRFSNVNVGEFHSRSGKKGFGWGLRNLPRQKVLSCLRKDGSLLIHCEVDVLPDLAKVQCVPIANTIPDTPRVKVPKRFVDCMVDLMESGYASDFVIKVEGQVFPVHRAILGSHSDVFRAMFDSSLAEAKSSTLEILEFSSDAVKQMIYYVYAGNLPKTEVEKNAEELIGLAEKYGLLELKSVCELELCERLTPDIVCESIALADLYNSASLKKACLDVITSNKKEVLTSAGWSHLKSRHPRLVNEILEAVVGVSELGAPSTPITGSDSSGSVSTKPSVGGFSQAGPSYVGFRLAKFSNSSNSTNRPQAGSVSPDNDISEPPVKRIRHKIVLSSDSDQ